MIFRIGNKLVIVTRETYSNDTKYYTEIYKLKAKISNTAKSTPTNKILSAMFIE